MPSLENLIFFLFCCGIPRWCMDEEDSDYYSDDESLDNALDKYTRDSMETNKRTKITLEECTMRMSKMTPFLRVRTNGFYQIENIYVDFVTFFLKSEGGIYLGDICKILLIRKGWQSDVFRELELLKKETDLWAIAIENFPFISKETSFSIVFKDEIINLVALDTEARNFWASGLLFLYEICDDKEKRSSMNTYLSKKFKAYAKRNLLSFNDCQGVMKDMGIILPPDWAKMIFMKAGTGNTNDKGEPALNEREFRDFYLLLHTRPDAKEIYNKFTPMDKPILGPEELMVFLTEEQNFMGITRELCEKLIEKYEPGSDENNPATFFSLVGFIHFLSTSLFDIFDEASQRVPCDMDQPLNNYFIASAKNAYQDSKDNLNIDKYLDVMKRGCRCVDVNCWNGHGSEPIVRKGVSTKTVKFKECLVTILKHSFTYSRAPLILSLESFCSSKQQKVAADLIHDVFHDLLRTRVYPNYNTSLPSPSQCRETVFLQVISRSEKQAFIDSEDESHPLNKGKPVLSSKLKNLISYTVATKFLSFKGAKDILQFKSVLVMSNEKAVYLMAENPVGFITLTKRHMVYIYPKSSKKDTQNFDPFLFWSYGCQMVCLNYNAKDMLMYLYEAFFSQYRKTGYVLKPLYLREDYVYKRDILPPPQYKRIVHLAIISGQLLPLNSKTTINPFVSVKIYGHKADNEIYFKTKIIERNGFNPIWNTVFRVPLVVPELAIFLIQIKDDNLEDKKEQLLGQYAIHFTCMGLGYRNVRFVDEKYKTVKHTTLFVHVKITMATE